MTRPPDLAVRLLTRRLHPDERDEIIGDLDEQFRRRADQSGAGRAARWYWRQALALAWGFAWHRRDVISTDHQRTRGWWAAGNMARDWRYAARSLRRSPGFAAVTMLTLMFGIGLSTAVFSLVNSILLHPLPYGGAERLVRLAEFNPQSPLAAFTRRATSDVSGGSLSDVTIGQWIDHGETLDAIVPFTSSGRNVTVSSETEQLLVGEVGGQFFDVLSLPALAGRVLQSADAAPSAPAVAVVSGRLARRVAGGPADVVGRNIVVEGASYAVVGVVDAPDFPEPNVDIWVPGSWEWPQPGARRMMSMSIDVIGRMKPGVTVDAVQREGERIVTGIATANPNFFDGTVPVPRVRVRRLLDDLVAPVRPALIVLSVGMVLVLLAACVNLANLVLARTTARQRDLSVRLALGASRARIARPLFFEQVLLASAGSALAAVLAWWTLRALPRIAPADLPRLADVTFNVTSLAFASIAAIVTACLVGLLPVWGLPGRASFWAMTTSGFRANAGSDTGGRTRSVLVVCQVALAAALLVGAALVGRSLMTLLQVDSGYEPRGVLTFQISLPEGWYRQTGRQTALVTALIDDLMTQPGVTAAGATSGLPLHEGASAGTFTIVNRPRPADPADFPAARWTAITPGYLAAVGTPIRRGRGVLPSDVKTSELVVLIDEIAAARYFPGEDPIGQRLASIGRKEWTIVGIVAAVHDWDLSHAASPSLYYPAAQISEILGFNRYAGGIAVRSTGDPMELVPFVRDRARLLEPTWPLFNFSRLEDRFAGTVAQPRFHAVVLGLFALLTLTTAVLGVYGVLAYAVERRRMEFSVRRALGASERDVLRLILRRGMILGGVGLAAGLGAAAGGSSLLRSQLFGVERLDPASFAGAAAILMAVVLAASWWPARRALGADPIDALKAE